MRLLIIVFSLETILGMNLDIFETFNLEHSKTYKSMEDFEFRRAIFMTNYNKMLEHNKRYEADEVTWSQGMHPDMDLTEEEWAAKRLKGLSKPNMKRAMIPSSRVAPDVAEKLRKQGNAPKEFNWVSRGAVSSVKDMVLHGCKSDAAFSVIAALESCYKIKTGIMDDDLSEQHIIDCAYGHIYNDDKGSWGAYGCQGSWPVAYMDWLYKGKQNQEEAGYQYTGHSSSHYHCKENASNWHEQAHVSDFTNYWFVDELDMEDLVQINPVSTAVQATSNWSQYKGGILDDSHCCNAADDPYCFYHVNHAILVVGYGYDKASGLDYWLIKNSWGSRWGEDGYVKLKKGTGHCGVGTFEQLIPSCDV